MYIDQLPRHLWVSPTKIITSSAWRSRRALLAIDVESGAVEELSPADQYPGSTTILYADSRWILATYSTPTEPAKLLLGSTDADLGKLGKVHFTELESDKVEKAKAYYQPHTWSIVNKIPGQLESLETILLEPFKSDSASQRSSAVGGSKPPLVIFPHGGPHSGFSNEFVMLPLVLVALGFAVACGNVVTPMIWTESKKATLNTVD